jgi:uncharacterized protein (TIGR02996 family)
MTDEAALLQAIADQPEADTPRLVYADWLDERGGEANRARAEFIRLQIMLYRLAAETAESKAARPRAAELLNRFATEWGFPPRESNRYDVRRGFIDEWYLQLSRGHAEIEAFVRCLSRFPITRVVLNANLLQPPMTSDSELIAQLDVPAIHKLRSMEIAAPAYGPALLEVLLSLRQAPALKSLTIAGVTVEAAVSIASLPKLGSLESLYFRFGAPGRNGGVRDTGAVAIATSTVLHELRGLSLRGTRVRNRGALALAASRTLGKLERLILTENPGIGATARQALRNRFEDRVFL